MLSLAWSYRHVTYTYHSSLHHTCLSSKTIHFGFPLILCRCVWQVFDTQVRKNAIIPPLYCASVFDTKVGKKTIMSPWYCAGVFDTKVRKHAIISTLYCAGVFERCLTQKFEKYHNFPLYYASVFDTTVGQKAIILWITQKTNVNKNTAPRPYSLSQPTCWAGGIPLAE